MLTSLVSQGTGEVTVTMMGMSDQKTDILLSVHGNESEVTQSGLEGTSRSVPKNKPS